MSYVLFSDGDSGAELRGPERHYARHLALELGFSCLPVDETFRESPLRRAVSGRRRRGYVGGVTQEDVSDLLRIPTGPAFAAALKQELTGFRDRVVLELPGEDGDVRADPEELLYNTAVVAGSDAVALLTRIHAHSEVHAWVDGPDREWLADVVETGVASGVLRQGVGWDGVTAFLRDGDGAVVLSASIGDTFPTEEYAGFSVDEVPEHALCHEREDEDPDFDVDGCEHADAWYDLDDSIRWARALEGLRERPRHERLQISPATLHQPMFAPHLTAFDVVERLGS